MDILIEHWNQFMQNPRREAKLASEGAPFRCWRINAKHMSRGVGELAAAYKHHGSPDGGSLTYDELAALFRMSRTFLQRLVVRVSVEDRTAAAVRFGLLQDGQE